MVSISQQENPLFFIVVTPHFERLALYELAAHLKSYSHELSDYEFHPGGIELRLPLEIGLTLNSVLKIPTRILLRLATKKVLSFGELNVFFKTLPWKNYFPLREVYVSSRSSKLKIKDAVKENFLKTIPFKPQKTGTDVYIRLFRDECTVSVDTSGEDLFVRGYQKWTGEAPIRDTMAAGLLQLSLQGIDDLSDWEVIDPMMGSGTFLLEAYLYNEPLERPFCHQQWSLEGIRKTVVRDSAPPKRGRLSVRGRDKNPKNVEVVKKNFLGLGLKAGDFKMEDVLSSHREKMSDLQRLVILNPPYGKRLAVKDKMLFQKIIDSVDHKYQPARIGIIVPRGVDLYHEHYERLRHFPFSNNGIDVDFYLFLRKQNI